MRAATIAFISYITSLISNIPSLINNNEKIINCINTFFLVCVTAGLCWVTWRLAKSTDQMRDFAGEANKANKEFFQTENRPWVSADISLGSGLEWNKEGGASVTLDYKLMNTGRTPGLQVEVEPEIHVSGADVPNPVARQKALSDEMLKRSRSSDYFGFTVFPGETKRLRITFTISAKEIDYFNKWMERVHKDYQSDGRISADIVGVIIYRDAYSKWHQTGFILSLHRRDPAHPNLAFVFGMEDGNLPIDRLLLTNNPMGSGVTF